MTELSAAVAALEALKAANRLDEFGAATLVLMIRQLRSLASNVKP